MNTYKKFFVKLRSDRMMKALLVLKEKKLRGMRELLYYMYERGRKVKVRCKPQSITINIEGRCNFKCRYCGYHGECADRRYRSYSYGFDQIKKQIDYAYSYGIRYMHVCGTGEPFLNKDIFKIFDYINKLGCKTSVLSNGSRVLSGKHDDILNANLMYFKTDMDAANARDFELITGRNQMDDVLANLVKLAELRAKCSSKMMLEVNTIITKRSLEQLKDILALLVDRGVDKWNLTQLLIDNKEKGWLTRDNKMLDDRRRVYDAIKEVKTLANGKIRVQYPQYFNMDYDQNELKCYKCWTGFMLNVPNYDLPFDEWYGNVVVGCTNEKTHLYPMGNMFRDSFDDIWNGASMRRLRDNLIMNGDRECRDMCVLHRFK